MNVQTHLHEHLHPVQWSRSCTGHGAGHGPRGQLLPPQTARLLLFCKLIWDCEALANVQHLQYTTSFHLRMCFIVRYCHSLRQMNKATFRIILWAF